MTVKEIVKEYLEKNKYDGLFFDGCCACEKHDLAPCGNLTEDCQAGYLQPESDEFEIFIGDRKPE